MMTRIRPGVTPTQIQEEAKKAMEPVFAKTKFSKPVYEKAARRWSKPAAASSRTRSGMAVHDDGSYSRGR